ncbi:MAG: hypothetical protein KatS3mg121_0378 [Gammaproteobacteria bacterium]|nr:MAG: hypothetical protein KatS3mg121_0378 [Gammaproteobacteria bacterium]
MAFPGRRRACFALLALAASALAWGQPQVAFSDFEFVPADPDRDPDGLPGSGDEYMDSGGTWNGAAEVTNSSGDTFRFTLSNTAAGQPDPAVDEIAYDLAVSLTLPAGLRLPVSPFPVTVTASGGDPGLGNCTAPAGVTATQSGSTVSFVLPPGTSLPGQGGGAEPCRLRFEFGLTTRDAVPFAPAGAAVLDYTATFNSVPGDPGSAAAVSGQQTVAVRRGDLIVTKSAVPNPADPNGAYAHGGNGPVAGQRLQQRLGRHLRGACPGHARSAFRRGDLEPAAASQRPARQPPCRCRPAAANTPSPISRRARAPTSSSRPKWR